MADYSIFVLGESQITISGGGQLDGVTQGDGSHLVGRTITLDAAAWSAVAITDDGSDADFSDNDSNQVLDGAQTIDGVAFASGTRLEAEYGITLSDGVNTWQAIGFNVNNSSPSYATIEGLAFIGGPGGFPPVGVPLTVIASQEGPSYAAAAYATPICYDRGTLIDTDRGPRPVESLRPGDRVRTLDNGFCPVRWVGGRHVIGVGIFAPVEIAAGVLGATARLRVSQQHRILVAGPRAELLFGDPEVFVPAVHLVDGHRVRMIGRTRVQYFHLLLDRHEVILANGLASESLFRGDVDSVGDLSFFGDLKDRPEQAGRLARRCLRRHEAALLLAGGEAIDQCASLRHSA